jgi:hypothetical protein
MTTQLHFQLGEDTVTVPVSIVKASSSPHTGRELRELLTTGPFSPVDAALITNTFCTGTPVADTDGVEWVATLESESWSGDGNGAHSLVIRWNEHETVRAHTVDIPGLSLSPTTYEERADDEGHLIISFRAMLNTIDAGKLRELGSRRSEGYWPVVRHGVSNEAILMRLGMVLWQRHGDDQIEHLITLVAQEGDRTLGHVQLLGGEPRVSHLIQHSLSLTASLRTLLAELQSAGVLGSDAVNRIEQAAKDAADSSDYEYFEVRDLSEW